MCISFLCRAVESNISCLKRPIPAALGIVTTHAALLGKSSAKKWNLIFLSAMALPAVFLPAHSRKNAHNPIKAIQLCGEPHQNLKSPVFSIFGQGALEMMKGFSDAQTCWLAGGQRGASGLVSTWKIFTVFSPSSPPGLRFTA